jgi:hypothetical protein
MRFISFWRFLNVVVIEWLLVTTMIGADNPGHSCTPATRRHGSSA